MNASRIRPTQAEHDAADYERECMRCGNLIPEGKPATLVTDSMSGPDKWQCSSCDELEALRAPVDVEGEVQTLVGALTPKGEDRRALALDAFDNGQRHKSGFSVGSWELWLAERAFARVRLRDVVAPIVERAAKFAREAEGLRARVLALGANNDALAADVLAARAEIDRLHKSEAATVRGALEQVGVLKADLARETARRDEQIVQLERRLSERETELTRARVEAIKLTAEIERLKDRPGKVFSEVIMRKDGQRYIGGWYDHSGQEYAHVTEAWLAARLIEQTGHEWAVKISEHGNGHYSAVATSRG